MDIQPQLHHALLLAKPFIPLIILGTIGILSYTPDSSAGPLAVPDQPQCMASVNNSKRGSVLALRRSKISYTPLRRLQEMSLRYQQHLMLGMPLSNTSLSCWTMHKSSSCSHSLANIIRETGSPRLLRLKCLHLAKRLS